MVAKVYSIFIAFSLSPYRNVAKSNYYDVISKNKELKQMTDQFVTRVKNVMSLANKYKSTYMEHSYLWQESRQEYMHYFLTYGKQLTPEELEMLEDDEKAVKKQYPTLDQFREQIDYYEGLHDQLRNIETFKVFQVGEAYQGLFFLHVKARRPQRSLRSSSAGFVWT